MTSKALSECYAILGRMKAGSDFPWDDTFREMYGLVLTPLSDDLGRAVVKYALEHFDWRPSVRELRVIADRLSRGGKDAEGCYAEIIEKAQQLGLYAKSDPIHPHVYYAGEPEWTDPIMSQIVRYCGGWEMICSGEANYQEGLKKQVRSAYASITGEQEFEPIRRQLQSNRLPEIEE